jgi:hypothetical protein
MAWMGLGKCEVCQERDATSVRVSCLGPYSFRFCDECLKTGREPRWLAEYTLNQIGGGKYENLQKWVRPVVKASLGEFDA